MNDDRLKAIRSLREHPKAVRYRDLCLIVERFFGPPRQTGGSHRVYRMPWAGDPRIDIQRSAGGLAKSYRVRKVIAALEKLEKDDGPEDR
ncbi:MAG: toxin HicA [Acidobacteria bacterium]|nr:toxin HicA [Acidobacteriota bacterium]